MVLDQLDIVLDRLDTGLDMRHSVKFLMVITFIFLLCTAVFLEFLNLFVYSLIPLLIKKHCVLNVKPHRHETAGDDMKHATHCEMV